MPSTWTGGVCAPRSMAWRKVLWRRTRVRLCVARCGSLKRIYIGEHRFARDAGCFYSSCDVTRDDARGGEAQAERLRDESSELTGHVCSIGRVKDPVGSLQFCSSVFRIEIAQHVRGCPLFMPQTDQRQGICGSVSTRQLTAPDILCVCSFVQCDCCMI